MAPQYADATITHCSPECVARNPAKIAHDEQQHCKKVTGFCLLFVCVIVSVMFFIDVGCSNE
jgi:hypothetical protein